jgi:hypothetical protein
MIKISFHGPWDWFPFEECMKSASDFRPLSLGFPNSGIYTFIPADLYKKLFMK